MGEKLNKTVTMLDDIDDKNLDDVGVYCEHYAEWDIKSPDCRLCEIEYFDEYQECIKLTKLNEYELAEARKKHKFNREFLMAPPIIREGEVDWKINWSGYTRKLLEFGYDHNRVYRELKEGFYAELGDSANSRKRAATVLAQQEKAIKEDDIVLSENEKIKGDKTMVQRRPGRPKKIVTDEPKVKRGRGRPKKVAKEVEEVEEVVEEVEAEVEEEGTEDSWDGVDDSNDPEVYEGIDEDNTKEEEVEEGTQDKLEDAPQEADVEKDEKVVEDDDVAGITENEVREIVAEEICGVCSAILEAYGLGDGD